MAGTHSIKQSIENKVYSKSLKDETFREELLNDPKSALEKELGVKIPDGIKIHVNENTATDFYITIPSKENTGELSEEELSGVSGGWHVCACTNCGEYTSFNPDCTPDC